jgi:hypothetical protein
LKSGAKTVLTLFPTRDDWIFIKRQQSEFCFFFLVLLLWLDL